MEVVQLGIVEVEYIEGHLTGSCLSGLKLI